MSLLRALFFIFVDFFKHSIMRLPKRFPSPFHLPGPPGGFFVLPAAIAALFLTALIFPVSAEEAPRTVHVGAASVDITPDYPIRLSGYGNRVKESEGVDQRLFAKALAFGEDEQTAAVLLTVDNVGVPAHVTEAVYFRVKARTGLKRENFALCSTHTHTGPMLKDSIPNMFGADLVPSEQAAVERYTSELTDKLARVALEALRDRKPATLAWGEGKVEFANNRRTPGGPVDHSLPILAARGLDGKLRAVLANYACHCTTLGGEHNKICGDWAGYAREYLEEAHPGAVALVAIGCGADANPHPRTGLAFAKQHGRSLAKEVNRLLKTELKPLTAGPSGTLRRFELPHAPPRSRAEWEERAKVEGAIGYHARKNLARLDRDGALPDSLPYSAQTWTFGSGLAMVFLPGEVVVDYALRLKSEHRNLWINAYANDVPCYIPSRRVLMEGGYEAEGAMIYYDRPGPLAIETEELIVENVRAILPAEFRVSKMEGVPPPTGAEESLKRLKLKPGFKAELVAAEPRVVDPVAIDFGPDGRLWVVEMRDYPLGMDGKEKPGGRVKVLEDADGDGRFEKATEFLDGLPYPTGLMVWGKGVFVCAAPDILYAEDTDGDGRADKVEKLFTGFATENYQARVNGLTPGLDGWIYGANGLLGGLISGKNGGKPVDVRGRDFRMNPDTGAFEPETGLTQQGRVRDDFGNWFGSDNSTLAWHYPLRERYLRRNPDVVPPALRVYVSSGPEHNRVYPASVTLERFNEPHSANRATAVCGGAFYRDNLFGEEYYGDYFVNESVHNLVTRMKIEPSGATFTGRRAADEQTSEFFASEDNWSRPVQVRTGPDGALWVVDMYRWVIEHPRWIPAEQLAKLDVRAGEDRGRIYRVYPEDKTLRQTPDLTKLDAPGLAAAMDTPNGTLRDMIQMELARREDAAKATPALAEIAKRSAWPATRTQALWTLRGLKALTPEALVPALTDGHAEARVSALRLAEEFLSSSPEVAEAVLKLKADPDFRVRFQLALSLGEWRDPRAGRALGELALSAPEDPWMRAAVLTSCADNPGEVLDVVLNAPVSGDAAGRGELLAGLIVSAVGKGGEDAARSLIPALVSGETAGEAWRFSAWAALLDVLGRKGIAPESLISSAVAEKPELAPRVERVFSAAGALAFDESVSPASREAALRLSGFRSGRDGDYLAKVVALYDSGAAKPLQDAAMDVLRRVSSPLLAKLLLRDWTARSPGARAVFMELLLSRPEWAELLLDALESGAVSVAEVTVPNRERLTKHEDAAVSARAEKIFAAFRPQGRAEVLAAYKTVASLAGNPRNGAELFKTNCGICHAVHGIGTALGPDISLFRDKGVQEYLEAILDPNAIVEPRFVTYMVEMKDGRVLAGLVTNESAGGLTVALPGGVREEVPRSEIKEMRASPLSLMPEGLENALPPQQMADLIAWLKTGGPRPFGSATPESAAAAREEFSKLVPENAVRVTEATEIIDYPCWMGVLTFAHCRQTDGNSRVVWRGIPVAEEEREGVKVFRFAGGLGFSSQPAGTFTLKVNGRAVLVFDVQTHDHVWTGEDGAVRLAYEVKENSPEDGNGLFTLEVADALLDKDKPAEFEVTGSASGSMRWFGLYLTSPEALALEVRDDEEPVSGRALIDDGRPASAREALIAKHPEKSAEFLKDMTADLTPGSPGTPEEYRRLPWIWRVTVAAGQRNDAAELLELLRISLPELDAPLSDWRTVVIGGGLINGVSIAGPWPGERLERVIGGDEALMKRWRRALELAVAVADDEKVPTATRYDALRMIPLLPWETCRAQLVKYAAKDVHPELQQGAVSGLADVNHPEAAAVLIEHFAGFTDGNKGFALDGLLRAPERAEALLDAIEAGKIPAGALGEERVNRLKNSPSAVVRERAGRLLQNTGK